MKKQKIEKNIYQTNMEAVRAHYPELAIKLDNTEVNHQFHMKGTGSLRSVNVFSTEGQFFYYDEEDPLKDVRLNIESLDLNNARLALFLGFGMGYELDYYCRNFSEKHGTRFILVVEKSLELFKTAIHMFDYSPMFADKRITLCIGMNDDELFHAFETFFRDGTKLMFTKAIKPVYHISSLNLAKDYYMNAIRLLKNSSSYVLNFFGNSPEDSLVGITNILANIGEIAKNPGVNLLYNKFNKKPAIIVATGPSLNKNKHLLEGLGDNALIVSVNAPLKVLMEMGVKPHLVTSLERFEEVVPMVQGYEQKDVQDVYLAASPVVVNEVYEAYPGPRIIVYRNFEHFRWIGIDRGILEIKHSAGNMAFKVAAALGCDPIILIGQDLAFSRDGYSHASGTVYGEIQEAQFTEGILEVMGNDGLPIKTNTGWNEFRRAYEIDIAEYEGRCINCTEGGAYIRGTEVMPLKDAIDKYMTQPYFPLEIIRESISKFTTADALKDLVTVKGIIENTTSDLKKMKEFCDTGYNKLLAEKEKLEIWAAKDSFDESDIENIQEVFNVANEYKMKVMNTQPTMLRFLMHVVQSFHIKFEIDLNEIPGLYTDEQRIQCAMAFEHLKWYAVIHDIIDLCLNMLSDAYAVLIAEIEKDEKIQ